jgi:hypothetical protein
MKNEIYGINSSENLMNVFDLNGILLKKIRLNHLILKPVSICTTKTVDENMKIFISDQGLRRILVFDKDFQYKSEFANELDIDYITLDDLNSLIYCVMEKYDLVSIWNFKDGTFFSQFSLKFPKELKVSREFIYAVCQQPSIQHSLQTISLENNQKSSKDSCLFIIKKNTYEIIHKIEYLCPICISMDYQNDTLLILAYQMIRHKDTTPDLSSSGLKKYKNPNSYSWSSKLFLFKLLSINEIQKIEITNLFSSVNKLHYFDNQMKKTDENTLHSTIFFVFQN